MVKGGQTLEAPLNRCERSELFLSAFFGWPQKSLFCTFAVDFYLDKCRHQAQMSG